MRTLYDFLLWYAWYEGLNGSYLRKYGNLEKIPRLFYEETLSSTPYFFLFPRVSKDVMTWYLFEMAENIQNS